MTGKTKSIDHVQMVMGKAKSIHNAMKRRGLYNGTTITISSLETEGNDIEVQVPTDYPIRVTAAMRQARDNEELARLLLAVNGVEYKEELLVTESDLLRLMGIDPELKSSILKKEVARLKTPT